MCVLSSERRKSRNALLKVLPMAGTRSLNRSTLPKTKAAAAGSRSNGLGANRRQAAIVTPSPVCTNDLGNDLLRSGREPSDEGFEESSLATEPVMANFRGRRAFGHGLP